MLSDRQLERVSGAYRNGYRDGYANRPKRTVETGIEKIGDDPMVGTLRPFDAFDYNEGYAAGANDAKWSSQYAKAM
jgi:hypothetical protein